jgi:sugar phosphate isomerase/epimerase
MKKLTTILLVCIIEVSIYGCHSSSKKLTPQKLGWKIGVQAYSFRKGTFFQAVDKVEQLGLHYIEAWPGQNVGGGIKGTMKWSELDKTARQKVKKYLKKQDVNMIAYGVVAPTRKAQWDSLFAFAHEMGIKNITAAPKRGQLEYVADLADKYHINVAIHDEPKPLHFWNPDTTLAAIRSQHNKYFGVCADVGNWVRSGVHSVKALKKLKGHIIELHMKDEKTWGKPNEDVVWGKGVENIPKIVNILYNQKFKGYIIIEYETNPTSNMPEIKKSLQYFGQIVAKLK